MTISDKNFEVGEIVFVKINGSKTNYQQGKINKIYEDYVSVVLFGESTHRIVAFEYLKRVEPERKLQKTNIPPKHTPKEQSIDHDDDIKKRETYLYFLKRSKQLEKEKMEENKIEEKFVYEKDEEHNNKLSTEERFLSNSSSSSYETLLYKEKFSLKKKKKKELKKKELKERKKIRKKDMKNTTITKKKYEDDHDPVNEKKILTHMEEELIEESESETKSEDFQTFKNNNLTATTANTLSNLLIHSIEIKRLISSFTPSINNLEKEEGNNENNENSNKLVKIELLKKNLEKKEDIVENNENKEQTKQQNKEEENQKHEWWKINYIKLDDIVERKLTKGVAEGDNIIERVIQKQQNTKKEEFIMRKIEEEEYFGQEEKSFLPPTNNSNVLPNIYNNDVDVKSSHHDPKKEECNMYKIKCEEKNDEESSLDCVLKNENESLKKRNENESDEESKYLIYREFIDLEKFLKFLFLNYLDQLWLEFSRDESIRSISNGSISSTSSSSGKENLHKKIRNNTIKKLVENISEICEYYLNDNQCIEQMIKDEYVYQKIESTLIIINHYILKGSKSYTPYGCSKVDERTQQKQHIQKICSILSSFKEKMIERRKINLLEEKKWRELVEKACVL